MASYISRVTAANEGLLRGLLAWEFDPDIFNHVLQRAIGEFKRANLKYDLLHYRAPGSPDRMVEQGYNLDPIAKGNDWSHISIGFIDELKPVEMASVYETAKQHVPVYERYRMSSLLIRFFA